MASQARELDCVRDRERLRGVELARLIAQAGEGGALAHPRRALAGAHAQVLEGPAELALQRVQSVGLLEGIGVDALDVLDELQLAHLRVSQPSHLRRRGREPDLLRRAEAPAAGDELPTEDDAGLVIDLPGSDE